MAPQHKPGFDGMQGHATYNDNVEAQQATPPYSASVRAAPRSSTNLAGFVLRIIVVILTLLSTIVMGIARETVIFVDTDPNTGLLVTTGAFWTRSTYSAAFVFFLVVNSIVFFYSVVSLVLSVVNKANISDMAVPLTIADVIVVALLFAANGAAVAISVVLGHGQQNLAEWTKICNVVGGFCARVNAAIVLSMVASLLYVILVVFGVVDRRRSY